MPLLRIAGGNTECTPERGCELGRTGKAATHADIGDRKRRQILENMTGAQEAFAAYVFGCRAAIVTEEIVQIA